MKTLLCKYFLRFVLIMGVIIGAACSGDKIPAANPFTLFDFEDEGELDQLHWECGAMMERDTLHASSGQYSLRIDMYPNQEYPGFKAGFTQGWHGYNKLTVDLYNPQATQIKITYRIDDRADNPPYGDRAQGSFVLVPGSNTLAVDLENLRTSGTDRTLALARICGLYLFVPRPGHPLTLYLDNVRLER
ncbi:MAG: hypothetical protein HY885_16265 [Deltaproteobacteria bacterium]|nr:hypothetical protein [Deltaproteobacteria bacterium]